MFKFPTNPRKKNCNLLTISFFVLLCPLLFQTEAYAYLDPGITSYGLQVIAASLVAVMFFARKFFRKVISFFIHGKSDNNEEK